MIYVVVLAVLLPGLFLFMRHVLFFSARMYTCAHTVLMAIFPGELGLVCIVFCACALSIVNILYVQVMHGGLFSEDEVQLDDLRKVDRNRQPPDTGVVQLMSLISPMWM